MTSQQANSTTSVEAVGVRQWPWVRETGFGKWFTSTSIWRDYVLAVSVEKLARHYFQATSENAAESSPISTLLDIGCGGGVAFEFLAKTFSPKQIIGIDIDESLLPSAHEKSRVCPAQTEVQLGSVYELALPTNSVDVIFCHQLLHHLTGQAAAVAELHRVLKPGGWLLMSESCARFIRRWWVRWFFRHPDHCQHQGQTYLDFLTEQGFLLEPQHQAFDTPWWADGWLGLGVAWRRPISEANAAEVIAVAQKAYAPDAG